MPWGCEGRECGQDGCGGTCGTCQAGQACTFDGRCIDVLPVRALRCGDRDEWSTAPERSLLDGYSCAATRDFVGPEAIYTYRSGAAGTVTVTAEYPRGSGVWAPLHMLVVLEDMDATRCVAAVPLDQGRDGTVDEVTRYEWDDPGRLPAARRDLDVGDARDARDASRFLVAGRAVEASAGESRLPTPVRDDEVEMTCDEWGNPLSVVYYSEDSDTLMIRYSYACWPGATSSSTGTCRP